MNCGMGGETPSEQQVKDITFTSNVKINKLFAPLNLYAFCPIEGLFGELLVKL